MMLAGTIWERELLEFAQRRRALVIKLTFPLVFGIPLVVAAPPVYAAVTLTMLIAIIGGLGAGAVLTRERHSGLTLRYRTLPVTPGRLLIERLSTSAVIDLLQVTPVLVLIALRHPSQVTWWPALVLSTVAVLLIGNLMGAVASTLSDSPGEVMLYVFIVLLPLLFLSGVFTSLTEPALLAVSRLLPFSYLHESLVGALGGFAVIVLTALYPTFFVTLITLFFWPAVVAFSIWFLTLGGILLYNLRWDRFRLRKGAHILIGYATAATEHIFLFIIVALDSYLLTPRAGQGFSAFFNPSYWPELGHRFVGNLSWASFFIAAVAAVYAAASHLPANRMYFHWVARTSLVVGFVTLVVQLVLGAG